LELFSGGSRRPTQISCQLLEEAHSYHCGPSFFPVLTNAINLPASSTNGCAIYIGPTAVDFEPVGYDYARMSSGRNSAATTPPAPHIARLRYDPWKRTTPKGWRPLAGSSVPLVAEMTGRDTLENAQANRAWEKARAEKLEARND
jgi:hypothetical protein